MKLAFVTPPSASALGRDLAPLAPALAARVELDTFAGAEGASGRPLGELDPRAFDHLLVVVADDPACAFAWPLLRRLGGTAALLGWSLERAARAARPALAGGGGRQTWAALQEGGWRDVERLGRRRRGERDEPLDANRSVVRHADSFLVADEELRARILAERNEPTPVAVVPLDCRADPEGAAAAWVEALARFPAHRSGRLSVARNLLAAARRHFSAGG